MNAPGARTVLLPGMFDHGREKLFLCFFPIQRPRHFRVLLTILTTFICAIVFPALFFISMGSVIITTVPMWERVSVSGYTNDVGIFMRANEGGVLSMRVCNGSVPYECADCGGDAIVDPSSLRNQSKNHNNTTALPSSSSSSTSSSSSSSRSAHILEGTVAPSTNVTTRTSHPNDLCNCGAFLDWNACELAVPPFDIGSLCPQIQSAANDLYRYVISFTLLGMLFPVCIGIHLIIFPMTCMVSCRFKRPAVAGLMLIITGVMYPAACLALTILLFTTSESMMDDDNKLCNVGGSITKPNSLAANGFRALGVRDEWDIAIAGIAFAGLSLLISIPILIRIWFIGEIPQRFGSSHWMFTPPTRIRQKFDCDCCDDCCDCYCCECVEYDEYDVGVGACGELCRCYTDYEDDAVGPHVNPVPINVQNREMTTLNDLDIVTTGQFNLESPPIGLVVVEPNEHISYPPGGYGQRN